MRRIARSDMMSRASKSASSRTKNSTHRRPRIIEGLIRCFEHLTHQDPGDLAFTRTRRHFLPPSASQQPHRSPGIPAQTAASSLSSLPIVGIAQHQLMQNRQNVAALIEAESQKTFWIRSIKQFFHEPMSSSSPSSSSASFYNCQSSPPAPGESPNRAWFPDKANQQRSG